MRFELGFAGLLLLGAAWLPAEGASAAGPADSVYRNGFIYTVDAKDSVQQALAIRAGRIVYVGSDAGVTPLVGANTTVVDLHGRILMPGLVDGHMHPLQGGAALLKCNLNYEQLSVAQMQQKIQHCLDESREREPDAWLEVVNWFQEGMVPAGTTVTRSVLDALKTRRPLLVVSSFGHTALANSRALQLGHISAGTAAPLGGRIGLDSKGEPSGILEDDAQSLLTSLLPRPTPQDEVKSARAALEAMRKQGVTTFFDADAEEPSLAAFASVAHAGELTARAHFALHIAPPEGQDADKAAARVKALAQRYDQGAIGPRPSMTARNVKLFLDGVIAAPALTGAMLEPYFVAEGTGAARRYVAGTNRGPEVYFPAPILRNVLIAVAGAGFDPHLHADGDRAVREGLDGIQALREHFPGRDIRAAIAHDEIVDPKDFARFERLNVIPVLSFQWEKRAPDTVEGARDYLGPARYKYIEPAGYLSAAGARIAFGSDWPVDPLDEWFALKVGVTRTNSPRAGAQYSGRLGEDAGLTRAEALRAITMNASYELRQENETGSLEPGKLADLIVLDRNVLKIPAEEIAEVKVLQTVVGGAVVYAAPDFAGR